MTNHIEVDPSDKVTWTFSAASWCTYEATGVTVSSATITPSTGVTIITEGAVAGNAKTVKFSASASGSIVCTFVMSDGNERQRTLTITVTNL